MLQKYLEGVTARQKSDHHHIGNRGKTDKTKMCHSADCEFRGMFLEFILIKFSIHSLFTFSSEIKFWIFT